MDKSDTKSFPGLTYQGLDPSLFVSGSGRGAGTGTVAGGLLGEQAGRTVGGVEHDAHMRGGYGTGEHGTLAQRVAGTTPPSPQAAPTPAHRSPSRHCHVDGEPSLLVEWRHGDRGWEGRVITQLWVDAVGWATLERWLPAGQITPG